jgi:hypothetical protein
MADRSEARDVIGLLNDVMGFRLARLPDISRNLYIRIPQLKHGQHSLLPTGVGGRLALLTYLPAVSFHSM